VPPNLRTCLEDMPKVHLSNIKVMEPAFVKKLARSLGWDKAWDAMTEDMETPDLEAMKAMHAQLMHNRINAFVKGQSLSEPSTGLGFSGSVSGILSDAASESDEEAKPKQLLQTPKKDASSQEGGKSQGSSKKPLAGTPRAQEAVPADGGVGDQGPLEVVEKGAPLHSQLRRGLENHDSHAQPVCTVQSSMFACLCGALAAHAAMCSQCAIYVGFAVASCFEL
jgi:hypothetical protein